VPYSAHMPEDPILFAITVANLVVPDAAEVVFSSLIPPGEAGRAAAPVEHGSGVAPVAATPRTARAEKRARRKARRAKGASRLSARRLESPLRAAADENGTTGAPPPGGRRERS
jgi:hypothetical protein